MHEIESIRDLIRHDKLDQALSKMPGLTDDSDTLTTIDHTKSSLTSLKQQQLRGVLDFREERIERSKIVNTILQILTEIEKADEDPVERNQTKILHLSAAPANMNELRFNDEVNNIRLSLRLSGREQDFSFEPPFAAVQYDQVSRMIRTRKPDILYISLHSSKEEGLFFQDVNRNRRPITGALLSRIIGESGHRINCVVLSACNSARHAEALSGVTNFAIGMEDFIPDSAGIAFARGFFEIIFEDPSNIERAFAQGKLFIELENIPKIREDAPPNHELPKLFHQ